MRGCTALVCYGLSNLPAANAEVTSAMQGVLSLSSNVAGVERAYDALKYRMFAESPHIEVTMPTLQWPHLAPPGRHVLMARVHYVPAEESAGAVGSACDAALEEALPGLADRAVHRSVFLPRDLGRKFGVADAGLSHGELALDQVLFMRPLPSMSRYRTPFRGLYLGGSGCHPGPMVNGAAGVLAARALLRVTA
jgi:phytoene dehydrogenase-like protein